MHIYGKNIDDAWADEKGKIADAEIVKYIAELKIPPAYKNVKVYVPPKKGKLLYIGYDSADRIQMIYSKEWRKKANGIKFCQLIAFGKALPAIHSKLLSYMNSERITKNKVIAVVLRIISFCNFRVGQDKYVERYNHHGITTITSDHVKEILGSTKNSTSYRIMFTGKKGVINECVVVDPACVKVLGELITQTKTLNDPHIFTWKEGDDIVHITAIDINNFLKTFNETFTSKMFRIFTTNVMLIDGLRDLLTQPKITKKAIVELIKNIAMQVHNTPAICKKEYIDQSILEMFVKHSRTWHRLFSSGDSRIAFVRHLSEKCKT